MRDYTLCIPIISHYNEKKAIISGGIKIEKYDQSKTGTSGFSYFTAN